MVPGIPTSFGLPPPQKKQMCLGIWGATFDGARWLTGQFKVRNMPETSTLESYGYRLMEETPHQLTGLDALFADFLNKSRGWFAGFLNHPFAGFLNHPNSMVESHLGCSPIQDYYPPQKSLHH